jgi:hypothetical protein
MFSKLERNIFRDTNVLPIFINETEQKYFELMYPGRQSELWTPKISKQLLPSRPKNNAFIYFGSYAHHQKPGIIWFLNKVFNPLRNMDSSFTVHFWGLGAGSFNDPMNGIFCHGEYNQPGLPMMDEGLFINPDLLGGGIKFKIAEWLEMGVPFISTPFGVEGFIFQRNENIIISDTSEWLDKIQLYFNLRRK